MINYFIKKTFLALSTFAIVSFAFAGNSAGNAKITKTQSQILLDNKGDFLIKSLPVLQNPTTDGITISWSTTKPAYSWVEVAPDDSSHFYLKDRQKFFDAPLGRKNISTFHNVKISGLNKNTKYRYRIFSQEVISSKDTFIEYGKIASLNVYKVDAVTFKTLNDEQENLKFLVLNDIHQDVNSLTKLLSNVDLSHFDFIVLNGDILNCVQSLDLFYDKIFNALGEATRASIPVYFVRGNHETRGIDAQNIQKIFPTNSGMPYYYFKYGKVAFVALDTGEDKPDSDIEYFSNNDFDSFRDNESKWLNDIADSQYIKNAPVKIVFAHMPLGMTDFSLWHGISDAKAKFVPTLNRLGADIIISGHTHKHSLYEAGNNGLTMPNITNSNVEMLEVSVDSNSIKIKAIDLDGSTKHEYSFKTKNSK